MTVEYFYGLNKEEKQGMILMAIEEHLYVDGWSLLDIFDEILSLDSDKFNICLALENGKAIGISLYLLYGHIMFFVKEEFRRLGIGKKMYKEILKNIDEPSDSVYAELGCDESKIFFNNVGIVVME